jgi:hypothetical protein
MGPQKRQGIETMDPYALLSILVETRAKLPNALGTPFLLQRTDQNLLSLSHPMFPEGGVFVDAETHQALQTLVQWGYLTQPKEYDSKGYVVTLAGLSYGAHKNESTWDGTERRQPRDSGKEYPTYMDRRSREQ